MMATAELLSILSVIAYFIPFCGFMVRYARSRWSTYLNFAAFCVLRIACYGVSAYYTSPAVEYASIRYLHFYIAKITLNTIGAITMMIAIGELYKSIMPKIHHHHNHLRTNFEKFAFHHIRVPFIPFAACFIAGCILASPLYSPAKQHNGDILRKFSIVVLLAINTLFMYIASTHSYKYPAHRNAFVINFASTAFFTVAVIYNIVITYNVSTGDYVWPAFAFGVVPELCSLAILSADLQTYFLGHKSDEIMTDSKEQV